MTGSCSFVSLIRSAMLAPGFCSVRRLNCINVFLLMDMPFSSKVDTSVMFLSLTAICAALSAASPTLSICILPS